MTGLGLFVLGCLVTRGTGSLPAAAANKMILHLTQSQQSASFLISDQITTQCTVRCTDPGESATVSETDQEFRRGVRKVTVRVTTSNQKRVLSWGR